MRKQHNFKVGDKIERRDGLTALVERIDPACNNVYGKDYSNGRHNGSEVACPDEWHVVTSAASIANRAADFISSFDDFEVTILKIRGGVSSPLTTAGFSCTFVQRETVSKHRGGGNYRSQVKAYLEAAAADLTVPGEYVAVAVYGDGDTITRQFSVKPLPVKAPVEVSFAA